MEKERQSVIVSRLLGILIKRKRESLNYSKEELSLLLHVKPGLLSKWESGKIIIPNDKFNSICTVLGISDEEIELINNQSKNNFNKFNILYKRSFIINLIAISLIVLSATIILTSLIFINMVNDIPRGRILVFTYFSDQYSYFYFIGISKSILLIGIILILFNAIMEILSTIKRNFSSDSINKSKMKNILKSSCWIMLLCSMYLINFPIRERIKEIQLTREKENDVSSSSRKEDVSYDLFYSTTMDEAWYECAENYSIKAPHLFSIRQEAKLLSISYYGEDSFLDQDSDSFRTLYISSMINYLYGEKFYDKFISHFDRYIGDDLTQINRQTMDLYNAKAGKRICEEFKKYQDNLSGTLYLDMGEFCAFVVSQGEEYQIYKLNEDCTSFIYTSIGKDNPLFR